MPLDKIAPLPPSRPRHGVKPKGLLSPSDVYVADSAETSGQQSRPPEAAQRLWPVREFLAERDRWGLWCPVGLGVGIAVYFALAAEPPLWLGLSAFSLAAVFTLAGRREPAVLLLGLTVLFVAGGFTAAQWRSVLLSEPRLEGDTGPVRVEGQVISVEPRAESGRGPRVILRDLRIERLPMELTPERVRIRLTARDPADVDPGARLAVLAVLRPPPAPAAPGAFDFARQAFFQRLGGVGYAVSHLEVLETTASGETWGGSARLWLNGLRAEVTTRIRASIPGTPGALAAALVTGERAAIPRETIEAMRDSGLAHLLAISGLHVGLVTALLFFGLRSLLALVPPLALDWPIKKWAAVIAALGALAYLLLAGATLPTQRAFIMILIVLTGVLLDRTAISLRLVAWAAALILILAPESLLSASFQMSFAATTALVAAYETLRRRRERMAPERGAGRKAGLYFGGVAFSSVIAICATAPFAIYHFNRFATWGLIANLVAVPLTAFWIMPMAVLGMLLMPFGLEAVALVPMGWGVAALITWAEWIASWPGAVVPVAAMPAWGLVLTALGGLWLCLWWRPWRLAGVAAIALGFLAIATVPRPDLLVTGDGRLFAIRDENGMLRLSSGRSAQFDADVWLRRDGQSDRPLLPDAGQLTSGGQIEVGCDPLGCIVRAGEVVLAVVRDGAALPEDCALADIVIGLMPVPRGSCIGPSRVIDFWDLRDDGAHAVRLSERSFTVESVAESRGRRPWSGGGR